MTYIFNIILCVSITYFFIFSLLVFLMLLKHVKVIVFERIKKMQNKTSVFDKKVVTRFDKKIATWRKKSIDEEKNLLLWTLKKKTLSLWTRRRLYH